MSTLKRDDIDYSNWCRHCDKNHNKIFQVSERPDRSADQSTQLRPCQPIQVEMVQLSKLDHHYHSLLTLANLAHLEVSRNQVVVCAFHFRRGHPAFCVRATVPVGPTAVAAAPVQHLSFCLDHGRQRYYQHYYQR